MLVLVVDSDAAKGDLTDTSLVSSIWSHSWPGSMDFTHGFKSSKHDEMLDSLPIPSARLAYSSNFTHTNLFFYLRGD